MDTLQLLLGFTLLCFRLGLKQTVVASAVVSAADRMTSGRLLCCFSLLLPVLLLLLPVLLPPFLIRLTELTSRATAYLDHKLGADLTSQSWEYIVVGAGSAGSVVAGRLAAAGHTVLLLEAGGESPNVAHIPAMVALLQKSPVDWAFVTEVILHFQLLSLTSFCRSHRPNPTWEVGG